VRRLRNILGLVLLAWLTPMLAMGQLTKTEVSLRLSAETARPGDTVFAAVRMQMEPKWHVYWRNYGDVGIANRDQVGATGRSEGRRDAVADPGEVVAGGIDRLCL